MSLKFKKISADTIVETDSIKFVTPDEKVLIASALQDSDIGIKIQAYDDKLKNAVALNGDLISTSDAQTLTNKTVDASANTLSNIDTTMFAKDIIDTDINLKGNSDTALASQKAVKAYVDAVTKATTGALIFKGEFDASGGTFPSAADTGCYYKVSKAGIIDDVDFKVGDSIFALVDSADIDTYDDNWLKVDSTDAISTVAGKVGDVTLELADLTDITATADEVNYLGGVTSKVQDQLDAKIEKASIETDGTLPASDTTVPSSTAVVTYVTSVVIHSTKVSDKITVDSDTVTLAETGISIQNIYVDGEGDVATGFTHNTNTDTIKFDDKSLDGKDVYVTYCI